jgi:hypothetical protein
MGDAYSQKNYAYMMVESVKRHSLSIGFWLVFFGVADLWFVMPNLYAGLVGDWPNVDWRFFYFYIPQWRFTVPALLLMTLVGTLMMGVYCIRGIQPQVVDNKQNAAILVTALGFTYQVIGAWPLWNQVYAWPWQAEIARYGNWLVFPLFTGSLIALIIGATSLYKHSKIYHQKNIGIPLSFQ